MTFPNVFQVRCSATAMSRSMATGSEWESAPGNQREAGSALTVLGRVVSGLGDGCDSLLLLGHLGLDDLALVGVERDEVTMLRGERGGGEGVALGPVTGGAVGSEDKSDDCDEKEDGDRDDGVGCAPGRVRGQAAVDKGLEERDLRAGKESVVRSAELLNR